MEKGRAVQNKFKLNDFKKELKKENENYYYLFLIAYNLGLNLDKALKLTRKEAEEYIKKRSDELFNQDILPKIEAFLAQFDKNDYIFQDLSQKKEAEFKLEEIYQDLNKLAQKVGIDNFGSQTLKRSYAYYHYQRYQDIDRIKDIMDLISPTAALHFMGYDDDRYLCFYCNRGCIYRKKYK